MGASVTKFRDSQKSSIPSIDDVGRRRRSVCMPPSSTSTKVSTPSCRLSRNLVRRDREVWADLDVIDVG